jgi:serine/threonine protein kinase
MGFTSIAASEQIRLANAAENNALIEKIRKKNIGDPEFKDMQIVRYGDLVIAIHRPKKKALSGGVGTVYTAYPVQTDGKIDKYTPLVVKISRCTGLTLENGIEKFESTAETRGLWSRTKEKITEQKKRHILVHMDNGLVSETINATTLVFSSRATTTSQQDKAGNTVHYRSILMSKVPGKSLDQLLADGFIGALKPEERLRLALNVIRAYKELHAQGFYHRDIKAENIMVDPKTLQVTVIDLDNQVSSCTRAPEDKRKTEFKPNALSDIYSLGIDVLPIILSGQRPRIGIPLSFTAIKKNE